MAPNPSKVKILTQSIATAKRNLLVAADKDSARRQIAAMEARLKEEKKRLPLGR